MEAIAGTEFVRSATIQTINTMKKETGSEPKFKTNNLTIAEPALQALFVDCLRDIYWAENHLVKTLPKMSLSANSKELITAIEQHLAQTVDHVARLDDIFGILGEKAIAKKCDAMEGLTKEGEGIIESTDQGTATRDVGIILASQKVEHYEISSYLGLIMLAKALGHQEIVPILEKTLAEEQQTDQLLATLAETNVAGKAAQEA
jgi:ferritin-like metal-binding protein YciE